MIKVSRTGMVPRSLVKIDKGTQIIACSDKCLVYSNNIFKDRDDKICLLSLIHTYTHLMLLLGVLFFIM